MEWEQYVSSDLMKQAMTIDKYRRLKYGDPNTHPGTEVFGVSPALPAGKGFDLDGKGSDT